MSLTAGQLISAVNRRCGWSATNGPLADSDASETHNAAVLAIANEELAGDAWPLAMKTHGQYYVAFKDYTLVANQRFYRLPERAYNAIKDVVWVDSASKEYSLRSVDSEDVPRLSQVAFGDVPACSYYLEADRIGLFPIPTSANGTLRVRYYLRPGTLVLTTASSVAPITSFSYSGTTGTVGWTSGQLNPDGQVCDIISAGHSYAALVVDATMAAASGDTNTFTWPFNPLVQSGDYLCTYGNSPVVQLPDHMLPYFVRRVAGACLTAHGDRAGAAIELQAAAQLYEQAQSISSPRDAGEPRTLMTRNSPLRVRGGYSWGR